MEDQLQKREARTVVCAGHIHCHAHTCHTHTLGTITIQENSDSGSQLGYNLESNEGKWGRAEAALFSPGQGNVGTSIREGPGWEGPGWKSSENQGSLPPLRPGCLGRRVAGGGAR